MKRDIVLICPGGCMSGVFGAGALTTFEEADLYPRIKTIYAGSAGALNSAYFLARQMKISSSIYYDDLIGKKFIKPKYVPLSYAQKAINKYLRTIPRKRMAAPVDLDYLFNIIKNKKKLDIKKILESKIEFKIIVTELDTLKLKIFNGKAKNLLKLLRASADLIPYYNHSTMLYGKHYIDGMIIDPIFVPSVLEKMNPRDKVKYKIIVINNSNIKRNLLYDIKGFLEATAAYFMYDKKAIYKIFTQRNKKFKEGLNLIKKYKNIYLIAPPKDKVIASTTDRKKLLATYRSGIKTGKEFLKKHNLV